MKAYIIGGNKELVNFMPDLEITDKLKEAKLVIFGDGPIVSPSLYKEKKLDKIDLKCDINRDRSDKAIYTKLKSNQIAIGISRGACFLAVMNGAKLVQYTYRKEIDSSYMVEVKHGRNYVFPAISNWSQSINLKPLIDSKTDQENIFVLGKSYRSYDYIADYETKQFMEYNGDPELIKFQRPNGPTSICIQFHPEWMPNSYLSRLVKEVIYECANS